MSQSEFLPTFLDEAQETLDEWEKICLEIEKDEHGANAENFNHLFRCAHNLKGSARSVGLLSVGGVIHEIENTITRLRTGELQFESSHLGFLLEAQKELYSWIDRIRADPSDEKISESLTSLLANIAETQNPSNNGAAWGLFESAPSEPDASLGEQSKHSKSKEQPEPINAAQSLKKDAEQTLKSPNEETTRVAIRKLDAVIRLIGEISIQQAILQDARSTNEIDSTRSHDAIVLMGKLVQDLQSEAMSLRMQPVDSLFQRLERVAKDVTRAQEKMVRVTVIGTHVELDKTVIDRMKDPLIHIIRNAVDHGIESRERRLEGNKQPTASLVIEATQTPTNVLIRISDDGKGLDERAILAKALQKGLLDATAKYTSDEIRQMIFLPGFSTAEKVTDVSGRGVGLDVVKKSVDDLGGSLSIESCLGQGTSFLISLPSTLSILEALVINLDGTRYAVPIQTVDEVVDTKFYPIQKTGNRGLAIDLRGEIVPIESLSDYLPRLNYESSTNKTVALITRLNSRRIAFQVDSIIGQQSIVVRRLEGHLKQLPGFAGATVLASGEPSMIIQLSAIAQSFLEHIQH